MVLCRKCCHSGWSPWSTIVTVIAHLVRPLPQWVAHTVVARPGGLSISRMRGTMFPHHTRHSSHLGPGLADESHKQSGGGGCGRIVENYKVDIISVSVVVWLRWGRQFSLVWWYRLPNMVGRYLYVVQLIVLGCD